MAGEEHRGAPESSAGLNPTPASDAAGAAPTAPEQHTVREPGPPSPCSPGGNVPVLRFTPHGTEACPPAAQDSGGRGAARPEALAEPGLASTPSPAARPPDSSAHGGQTAPKSLIHQDRLAQRRKQRLTNLRTSSAYFESMLRVWADTDGSLVRGLARRLEGFRPRDPHETPGGRCGPSSTPLAGGDMDMQPTEGGAGGAVAAPAAREPYVRAAEARGETLSDGSPNDTIHVDQIDRMAASITAFVKSSLLAASRPVSICGGHGLSRSLLWRNYGGCGRSTPSQGGVVFTPPVVSLAASSTVSGPSATAPEGPRTTSQPGPSSEQPVHASPKPAQVSHVHAASSTAPAPASEMPAAGGATAPHPGGSGGMPPRSGPEEEPKVAEAERDKSEPNPQNEPPPKPAEEAIPSSTAVPQSHAPQPPPGTLTSVPIKPHVPLPALATSTAQAPTPNAGGATAARIMTVPGPMKASTPSSTQAGSLLPVLQARNAVPGVPQAIAARATATNGSGQRGSSGPDGKPAKKPASKRGRLLSAIVYTCGHAYPKFMSVEDIQRSIPKSLYDFSHVQQPRCSISACLTTNKTIFESLGHGKGRYKMREDQLFRLDGLPTPEQVGEMERNLEALGDQGIHTHSADKKKIKTATEGQSAKPVKKRKEKVERAPKRPRKPPVAARKPKAAAPQRIQRALEDGDETEDEDLEFLQMGIPDTMDIDVSMGVMQANGLPRKKQKPDSGDEDSDVDGDDDDPTDHSDEEADEDSDDEEAKAEKRYFEETLNAATKPQSVSKSFDLEATLKEAEAMLDGEDTEDEVEGWGVLNV
mmetsp:Transcript_11383/g.41646  ORF Transcript_11383/g.41646 Transcript_11383/m.41646 type:complete len:815 (+) Transcript_11383:105-2549(+)